MTASSSPQVNCKVCGSPHPLHAGECRQCGAVYDEASRCPHCRALAGTELRSGRHVCRICGGPRIPATDRRVQRRGREKQALVEARATRARARRRAALAVLAALFTLLSALVAVTLGWLELPLVTVSWLASGLWLATMLVAWNRARAARSAAQEAEERAWVDVTEDAVASFPEVTERDVGELLGVAPDRAEALLTRLVRQDRVDSEIDDDARIVFRRPRSRLDGPSLRLRVDELSEELEDDASETADEQETRGRSRV